MVVLLISGWVVPFLVTDYASQYQMIHRIGGIGYVLYFITTTAYIIDSVPEDSKGKQVGAYQLIMGLATFLGSLSMGVVTEFLIPVLSKWPAIYTLVRVVMFLRIFGGLTFYFVDEPAKPNLSPEIR